MLTYNELYEILRKEKYSEILQQLSKNLLIDFSDYLKELRTKISEENDLFSTGSHAKKQLENSISLFKGLVLRRKKKLLNLVFIAAETGIMKKDYENMLDFEKKVFDDLIKSLENGDKDLSKMLNGEREKQDNKMIILNENVEQFVDMNGKVVGPFGKGELINLDFKICDILVSVGKARFVEE